RDRYEATHRRHRAHGNPRDRPLARRRLRRPHRRACAAKQRSAIARSALIGHTIIIRKRMLCRCALARRKRGHYTLAMSITAIVENGTIKLPVHVPDGTCVEIILPEKTPGI